jgi:hypothetical protein
MSAMLANFGIPANVIRSETGRQVQEPNDIPFEKLRAYYRSGYLCMAVFHDLPSAAQLQATILYE